MVNYINEWFNRKMFPTPWDNPFLSIFKPIESVASAALVAAVMVATIIRE